MPLYELKSFTEEELASVMANEYTTPFEVKKKNHFDYFFGYLKDLETKKIVLEPEYISKDYLHDYTSYYSLCFKEYPKFCSRVHFFSLDFDAKDFETLINNGSPSVDIRNSYLGFIVIRPIPNTVIGFTALKPYVHSSGFNQRNFWGLRKYPVHLFGIKLEVESLAFQEQDSVVSACATAAIWSMLHGASYKSSNTVLLKSPSEITRDAGNSSDGNRLFPNKGLDVGQICESIFKAGLVCEVKTQTEEYKEYDDSDVGEDAESVASEKDYEDKVEGEEKECCCARNQQDDRVPVEFLKKILNAYSLVSIPIILVIHVDGQDDHGLHAITVSGFFRGKPKAIDPRKKMSFLSDNIEKIYAHDDQWGPFAKITFLPDNLLQTKWTEIGHEVSINSIIIPVYPKIRISYEEIDGIVRGYDAILTLHLNNYISQDLVWDIKIIMNQDYKDLIKELTPPEDYPRKLKWLTNNFPKYIWMVDCWISDHIILQFAFDATGVNQDMLGLHIISHLDDRMKTHLINCLTENKNDESFDMIHHPAKEQYYNFLLKEIDL